MTATLESLYGQLSVTSFPEHQELLRRVSNVYDDVDENTTFELVAWSFNMTTPDNENDDETETPPPVIKVRTIRGDSQSQLLGIAPKTTSHNQLVGHLSHTAEVVGLTPEKKYLPYYKVDVAAESLLRVAEVLGEPIEEDDTSITVTVAGYEFEWFNRGIVVPRHKEIDDWRYGNLDIGVLLDYYNERLDADSESKDG